MTTTHQDIYNRGLDLLARREHSRHELQRKLLQRFPGESEAVEVQLDKLAQTGLQSEARFTEAYLRMRANAGMGPVRIQQELRERKITETLIRETMEDAALDWSALAEQARQKKFGDQVALDTKARMKQWRFLAYRGFTQEQFNTVDSSDDIETI